MHASKISRMSSPAYCGISAFPPPVLEWLGDAVLESDRTEQAAREQTIERLRTQSDQIQSRIETMYLDKLDGSRITAAFYDERAGRSGCGHDAFDEPVVQAISARAPDRATQVAPSAD